MTSAAFENWMKGVARVDVIMWTTWRRFLELRGRILVFSIRRRVQGRYLKHLARSKIWLSGIKRTKGSVVIVMATKEAAVAATRAECGDFLKPLLVVLVQTETSTAFPKACEI